jgi:hypothetical protein
MTKPDSRLIVQQAMRAAFPQAEERVARFYRMQEYHLGWRNAQLEPAESDPGKLIRPALVLLACEAAGGDAAQALPLAAGVQLLHDFTLIHDDIEDNSSTRRGRPTLWSLWGLAQGINAGDGMFVLAHLAIHGLQNAGLPAERTLAVPRPELRGRPHDHPRRLPGDDRPQDCGARGRRLRARRHGRRRPRPDGAGAGRFRSQHGPRLPDRGRCARDLGRP